MSMYVMSLCYISDGKNGVTILDLLSLRVTAPVKAAAAASAGRPHDFGRRVLCLSGFH